MQEPTRIYEDDSIRIESSLIDSNSIVFSFNSFADTVTAPVRSGHPFLRKLGFSVVHITALRNHWWQFDSRERLADLIRPLSGRYARRITYGASMGGHGALLLAPDLEATGVVAIAPQTIISDPRFAMRPAWTQALSKVKITRDDIADTIARIPDVRLIYDPWMAMDRAFIDYLSGTATRHYQFPFIGHKILAFLKEIGMTGPVMSGILGGTLGPNQVREMVRPLRQSSPRYVAAMTERCAARRLRT